MRLKEVCEDALNFGFETVGEAILRAKTTSYLTWKDRANELEELEEDINRANINPDTKIEDFLKRGICDLCDEILRVQSPEWRKKFPHYYNEVDCLVRVDDNYKIYSATPDDPYYSGTMDIEVNYCPKCGRKLRRNK